VQAALEIRQPRRARRDLVQRYQLFGIWIVQRFQQHAIHNAEDRRVRADSYRDRQQSHRGKHRVAAERAQPIAGVREKFFNGRPAPDAATILFGQRHIPKRPPSRGSSLFSRHSVRHQLLDLLFDVLPNLFRKIFVEPLPREQLFQPTHDSILFEQVSITRASGP
jgi:hypothetical protein